jgi:hypothetical protein
VTRLFSQAVAGFLRERDQVPRPGGGQPGASVCSHPRWRQDLR